MHEDTDRVADIDRTDDVDGVDTTSRTDAHGVIHDIGYRHHDGPRLGRSYIRRSLFVESAKGAYGIGRTGRAKVMPLLLFAVMCLPAIIMVVITAVVGAGDLVDGYTTYLLNLQMVVAIYVAGQAPASVSRDLRFGVMSLYLSRPLERIDYVSAKYAALSTAIFVLVATPLTILFVGALLAGLPLSGQVPDYLRGLAGAGIAALLLAGIGLVIAALTPRRGLGVAAIITTLLVLTGVQGASQAIAFDVGAETAAEYLGVVSPFTLVDGIQTAVLGADTNLYVVPSGPTQGAVYLGVAVLLVVASFTALQQRYRRVRVS